MKAYQVIILAALAMSVCQISVARTDKTDNPVQVIGHFGISGAPSTAGEYFTRKSCNIKDYTQGYVGSFERIIGNVQTTGTFLAGVDIKFNRVIAVSVDLGVNAFWCDTYTPGITTPTGTNTGIAVYIFPKAKLYYLNRSLVRLYGTAGFGVGKYFGYPALSSEYGQGYYAGSLKLEGQIVPFGIEVGKKFFGFAEFGVGTIFMGVQLGVGYRF